MNGNRAKIQQWWGYPQLNKTYIYFKGKKVLIFQTSS